MKKANKGNWNIRKLLCLLLTLILGVLGPLSLVQAIAEPSTAADTIAESPLADQTEPVSIIENPASAYNYDETDQEQVKVVVTFSSDGVPLLGIDEDQTPLCQLEVSISYFDLSLYELERFYRYSASEDGSYSGERVIARPTLLHLYIYMIERYYLGLPEEDCCKGSTELWENAGEEILWNLYGEQAYENKLSGLQITGSATSMYMSNFWGHDENLMYYRNHVYPLQSEGWGSTADYILLSDGDRIDLGMFTDWNFYLDGGFLCFAKASGSLPVDQITMSEGSNVSLKLMQCKTTVGDEDSSFVAVDMENVKFRLYNADWKLCEDGLTLHTGTQNTLEVAPQKAGTYYLLAIDENGGTDQASKTPASLTLVVKGKSEPEETTEEETTEEETTAEETTAEETTAEETTAEETTAEETTAEETTAEETTAEETTAEETSAQETSAEETSAQETSVVETSIEETSAEETIAVVTAAPKTGTKIKTSKSNYKITKRAGKNVPGEVSFLSSRSASAKTVAIPSTIKVKGYTYKVTSIASYALRGKTKLTKLSIGTNVKKIGTKAFYGCKNLKAILIQTTKLSSSSVGKSSFSGLYSKAVFKLPRKKYATYRSLLKKRGASGKKQTFVKGS